MKYLKSYKQINEGLRDKMLPKSDEDILKELSNFDPNGMLVRSAQIGFLDGIKEALKRGADIHHLEDFALRFVSIKGYLDIVKFLVENGAHIQADNNFAMRMANENGHNEIVEYLKSKMKLTEGLRDKMLPKPKEEIISYIKKTLNIDDDYIQVKLPEPKEIKKIKKLVEISDEYNIDIKDYKDNNVIICGNIFDVFYFMEFYLYYTLMNKRNSKTFHIDYIKNNIINNLNEGLRDKMLPKTDEEILKDLIKLEPNEMLIKSAKYGILKGVEEALKRGANIHTDNDWALRYASYCGHLDVVKYLVQNGADIHAYNDGALQWASENGNLDVVKYLVQNGANIHANDDLALRWASESGHLNIVKYLVENGAHIQSDNNFTIRRAIKNGHLKVVEYLKSKMKDK